MDSGTVGQTANPAILQSALKTSLRFKFDATGGIWTNLAQSFSLLGDEEENLNFNLPQDSVELPVDEWMALLASDFMRLSDSLKAFHKLHHESVTALEGKLTLLSTLIGRPTLPDFLDNCVSSWDGIALINASLAELRDELEVLKLQVSAGANSLSQRVQAAETTLQHHITLETEIQRLERDTTCSVQDIFTLVTLL